MIFILGGARSGKSRYAQKLALKLEEERGGQVIYIATGSAGDEEMRERIEKHQMSRPDNWKTVEAHLKVSAAITEECREGSVIIIDCITLLLSNILLSGEEDTGEDTGENIEERISTETDKIIEAAKNIKADVIIVSNEVGLGIVPEYKLGRRFRDIAGCAHQRLADAADEVYLMTAGLAQKLK